MMISNSQLPSIIRVSAQYMLVSGQSQASKEMNLEAVGHAGSMHSPFYITVKLVAN